MSEVRNVPEYFGCNVFNETVMKDMLPKTVYKSLLKTKQLGIALDPQAAEVIAAAMKDWAVSKGATHYTHWFHPMTGLSAEKHDSFISPTNDGRIIMEFSGKELVKGEPDASSFPSGGLRATFEARGYTAWDPTSPAFIKDNTLYIPTAFCSYTGEILDKKTPLLRSMDVISEQAMRVLRLFGDTAATRVITTVGPEQEYFLVDKELYDQREDLIFAGRTLFGAKAPKGQELEDHYFGNIKTRVQSYMKELDEELWKLGIFAKTEHNEVAPAQHELAPIYTTANVASDHNALTMELMKKIALKHGLVCLLHEKPYAGVNGSGKHNNWSICTDTGEVLLDPGKKPKDNIRFLTFLVAIIKAVHENSDLLRLSVASAGNDHRLGANEAPPAIISIFVGDELQTILDALETGKMIRRNAKQEFVIGVEALPNFPKDTTDRNRTSPFAFTGNKFEFRSLGSADTIACTNTILNTIVADVLCEFADKLEGSENLDEDLNKLLKETYAEHKSIIFNGNGYDDAWIKEAEKRGLCNYRTTADCMPHLLDQKNADMLISHGVFSEAELHSRCEIMLENYCKSVTIEARTMIDMSHTQILPAVEQFTASLALNASRKMALDAGIACRYEKSLVKKLSALTDAIAEKTAALEQATAALPTGDVIAESAAIRDAVLPAMEALRTYCDEAETLTDKSAWPFPTYAELLFGV